MIRFPFNNKHGAVDYMTLATWGEIADLDYDGKSQFLRNNIHDFRESLVNVGDEGINGFYIPAIIGLKESTPPDGARIELQTHMLSECLINKGKNQVPEFVSSNDFYNSDISKNETVVPWYADINGFICTPTRNFEVSSVTQNFFPANQGYVFWLKYVDESTLDEQVNSLKTLDSLTISKDSHISILNAIMYMNMLASAEGSITYKRHIGFYLITKYGSSRETGTICSFSIGGNNESSFEKNELEFTGLSARPDDHDYLLFRVQEVWE